MANAADSGTFTIGGDLTVHRLGFGAMRITGDGTWGPPADRAAVVTLLRRVLDLGVTLIDTADSYGPYVSEELIATALHPYPEDLVVATKGGFERSGPGRWHTNGRPEHLRDACEGSLQRLRLDTIDLYQLHRIDRKVPVEEQIGVLTDLQSEGKIRHIGLSEVSVEQLDRCEELATIVSVQNRYNLTDRGWEDVLDACADRGVAFLPWYPIATGTLAEGDEVVARVAQAHGATAVQIALAWLLARSRVVLPIPGTSSVAHLEENVAAGGIELDEDEMQRLDAAA